MNNQSTDRTEIFLALAEKYAARREPTAENNAALDEVAPEESSTDFSAVIQNYLTAKESEKFRRLQNTYQNKTEIERVEWQTEILSKIGTDEQSIDETVHWSYISAALQKESAPIQKIIYEFLSSEQRQKISAPTDFNSKSARQSPTNALKKTVRRAFAKQFIARRNLSKPTAFDCLNGSQTARLIRSSGIREVALACLQIEAVELVAAFLRRFSTEDAPAIAAQLNSLPKMSEDRLEFAENIVRTMVEAETEPSAMLDLLGINLVGIALCRSPRERIIYTNQKLPLEVAPQLAEISAEQCRRTSEDLQIAIGAEIEQIAQTIYRSANEKKPAKS